MPYSNCKVYFDGSHYIAIPHTERPSRRRSVRIDDGIETLTEDIKSECHEVETEELPFPVDNEDDKHCNNETDAEGKDCKEPLDKTQRKETKKEIFERLYAENINLKRGERKSFILKEMLPYFKDRKIAKLYVDSQFERKQRNLICRRIRLTRKINLQEFNYFCTFTYDGSKLSESDFKKKLRSCFKMMCHRKKWKYAGVWERSPEKKRLHFHGLFYIPEGSMPGELIVVKDYSPIKNKVQVTTQNTYFNERFGRSDFKTVDSKADLGSAIAYLAKYMEKTGEKIVYSKGLPQFFYSDIEDDDVVCKIGVEETKLLLFDNFICWDEGEYIGPVSKDVIEKLRKGN